MEKERYASFIKNLQIVNISLKRLRAEKRLEILPETVRIEDSLETQHRILEDVIHFVVKMEIKFKNAVNNRIVASISLSLELSYHYSEPPTEDMIEEFKKTSLLLNAWPYLRFWIQTITQGFGWPPLIIPLLKVYP